MSEVYRKVKFIVLFFFGVMAWFFPDPLHADATTVFVSSSPGLVSALARATGGETIELSAAEYGELQLSMYSGDFSYPDFVTIKSRDRGAVFSGGYLYGVDHVRLDGLVFRFGGLSVSYGSTHVEIVNCLFYGSEEDLYKVVVTNANGLGLRNSQHILVSGNEFHTNEVCLGARKVEDVTIRNNYFHDYRRDATNFNALTNTLIENNLFTRNHRLSDPNGDGDTGDYDHADFIQFWTLNDGGSSHVTIRGNVLWEADGNESQGIFIQENSGKDSYDNFLIEHNLVMCRSPWGILFETQSGTSTAVLVSNTVVRNNTVLSTPPPRNNAAAGIVIRNHSMQVVNYTARDNITTHLSLPTDGVTALNNVITQWSNPLAENHYTQLFLNAMAGLEVTDFLAVPGSVADSPTLGAQSWLLSFSTPSVYLAADLHVGTLLSHTARIRALPYPGGSSAPSFNSVYEWDFGDGTSYVGASSEVDHRYQYSGLYRVQVTVRDQGVARTGQLQLTIINPLLVDMPCDNTLTQNGSAPLTPVWVGTPTYAPGLTGSGLRFESSGLNYVYLPKATQYLANTRDLSIGFDFKSDGPKSHSIPLYLYSAFGVNFNGTKITFELGTQGGGVIVSTPQVGAFDNSWHRVNCVYDSTLGIASLYLDGKLLGQSEDGSGIIAHDLSNRSLTLGTDTWGKNFAGVLDNFTLLQAVVPPDQEASILADLRNPAPPATDPLPPPLPPASDGEKPRAFPNPFVPGKNILTVSHVSPHSVILVCTLDLKEIQTLTSDANGQVQWDGKNSGGDFVASGIYWLYPKNGGWKKPVTVVIQR